MRLALLVSAIILGSGSASLAQSKELKTEKDKPVILLNMVNMTVNCQTGPLVVPEVQKKPDNGNILMQVRTIDVPAKGKCLAQKVPGIAIFYNPGRGFVGTDSVKIAIEVGEKRSELEYKIAINQPGDRI